MRQPLFHTRITELFGIRHPILCGGLMWLADAAYVAAAVRAGGMGFMTAVSFPDPGQFRDELQKCRALTKGQGFGVNFSVSRRPGVIEQFRKHVRIACEERIPFIETSGASPEPILAELKEAGAVVMHKVPAVKYVATAQRLGADAVAVVGAEAGGHPGTVMTGTMVQAAQAPAATRLPVVIGGGIGTGRQIAAALAMGADGVLLGSRLLVAEEVWAHRDYKTRVVAGDGTDSRVVMQTFRAHHRVLDNEGARAVAALEAAGETEFSRYREHVAGDLVREAYATGDLSRGMIDYGQATCFADAIEPMEGIFDRLIDDAAAALDRLEAIVRHPVLEKGTAS